MRGNLSNKTMDFEEYPRDKRLKPVSISFQKNFIIELLKNSMAGISKIAHFNVMKTNGKLIFQ
ncbi:hypothetical protein DV30_00745 [Leptospira interrogans serovar Canicola str. Gui44]|nr:hypothetical protein DV38_17315 [Leptospira interrogans]OQM33788.1 hypothetical protein DV30_00745 [Leptospira interrogans serovar Canicola str. Gui44]